MTKHEVIEALRHQYPHYPPREVERMVYTIFDSLTGALVRGEGIELRGFGSFVVKRRAARSGPTPARARR